MLSSYRISKLPTHIVINRDGIVMSAEFGEQGFRTLWGLLNKAGLEVE